MTEGPGRSTGDEVGQSEATNIKDTVLSFYKAVKCNLNDFNFFFITIHPYRQHRDFSKNQNISKIYDKVRRKLQHVFIVKEVNKKEGAHHYHVIGYARKGLEMKLRGLKIWVQPISALNRDPFAFTPVREIRADILDFFQHELDLVPTDAQLTESKREIQKTEGKEYAKHYCSTRYTVYEQLHYIIRYMMKSSPTLLYKNYIAPKGRATPPL